MEIHDHNNLKTIIIIIITKEQQHIVIVILAMKLQNLGLCLFSLFL